MHEPDVRHEPDEREWLERVRAQYRRELPGEPERQRTLLDRLAGEPAPRLVRPGLGGWIGRQPPALRIALACAASAAIVTAGIGVYRGLGRPDSQVPSRPAAVAPDPSVGAVTFALRAPRVTSVAVVGDFNSWDPRATPMRRQGQGDVWTAQVDLSAGLH